MDVTVSVVGRDAGGEELRSLFTWLAGEDEFRGQVRLVEAVPIAGALRFELLSEGRPGVRRGRRGRRGGREAWQSRGKSRRDSERADGRKQR